MKTSIGLPVYNEAAHIARTLATIDGQADRLIICDDASTDETGEICRDFAASRPYVHYERLEQRRGSAATSRRCLDLAETPFFMWMAGHDLLPPGHVRNLLSLAEKSGAVLTFSPVNELDGHLNFQSFHGFDYARSLSQSKPENRLEALIFNLTNLGLYHGLCRTEALRDYYAWRRPLGDKILPTKQGLLMYLSLQGKFSRCEKSKYIQVKIHSYADTEDRWRQSAAALAPGRPGREDEALLFPRSVAVENFFLLKDLKKLNPPEKKLKKIRLGLIQRWLRKIY